MEEKKVKEITEEQSEKKAKKSKKGFTLIELIVCVTLLGVLMALIIPGLMKQVGAARENTAMTQCMSCVSAAEMNTVMDEAWETIDEPEVPLAALPRTTTAKRLMQKHRPRP